MDTHTSSGQRRVAAAAERNAAPLLELLRHRLGALPGGLVLEVASGTGQHAAHFASALPQLTMQPSEAATEMLESIAAWGAGAANVLPPLLLDASQPGAWPVEPGSCAAVLCINMAHISPWAATQGLVAGAGVFLRPGGQLLVYGPFAVDGRPTTDSNAAFDRSLRAQNPAWGLRDVAAVDALGSAAGLRRVDKVDMPANNFTLVYEREPAAREEDAAAQAAPAQAPA